MRTLTLEEEVIIVTERVTSLGRTLELPGEVPALDEIRRIVTIFRELRSGMTLDGKRKLKQPSGTLSTMATAIQRGDPRRWIEGKELQGVVR